MSVVHFRMIHLIPFLSAAVFRENVHDVSRAEVAKALMESRVEAEAFGTEGSPGFRTPLRFRDPSTFSGDWRHADVGLDLDP